MTDHVRTSYRRHRKATWIFLVALAAGALAAVLPALGAVGDPIPPASKPAGVTPTVVEIGGSNFDCTGNTGGVGPAGLSTFQVPNPPQSQASVTYNSTNTANMTTPLPSGVSFTLKGLSGPDKGKFFAFQATGASVFHVGVKGGNDQAWYNYTTPHPGGVTADGTESNGNVSNSSGLHATKTMNNFNVASYATFCYKRASTISGRVFLDNDGDGAFDASGTPPDAGQNGWTVTLFNTSSGGSPVPLTTPSPSSAPAGSYTFTVPIGSNYKVCVQPPADSGTWDQTAPSGTDCSGVSSALPAGRVITNLQSPGASNQDFGVQATIEASCIEEFGPEGAPAGSEIVDYKAQLTNPDGGTDCKPAVVMYSFDDLSANPYAIIHPTASADPDDPYWVVERLRMKVAGGAQNPVTLKYDDTPFYGDAYTPMKMCTADPRATGEEFALGEDPTNVMPPGMTAYGGPETTCMIQSTDFPSGNLPYNYEAYIATIVDGIKTPT